MDRKKYPIGWEKFPWIPIQKMNPTDYKNTRKGMTALREASMLEVLNYNGYENMPQDIKNIDHMTYCFNIGERAEKKGYIHDYDIYFNGAGDIKIMDYHRDRPTCLLVGFHEQRKLLTKEVGALGE